MRARRDRLRRHRHRAGRRRLCRGSPSPLADAHFRRLVRQFHRLGPRPLAELLAELAAERMLRSEIEVRLTDFVIRLDRERLAATGGAELVALRPWLVPPNRDTPQPEEGL